MIDSLVAAAKKDLAQRTGVSESQITVAGTSEEEWRDSSLGCPKPGQAYAQVITPGFRIILDAAGKKYEYHTDSTRAVLCQVQ